MKRIIDDRIIKVQKMYNVSMSPLQHPSLFFLNISSIFPPGWTSGWCELFLCQGCSVISVIQGVCYLPLTQLWSTENVANLHPESRQSLDYISDIHDIWAVFLDRYVIKILKDTTCCSAVRCRWLFLSWMLNSKQLDYTIVFRNIVHVHQKERDTPAHRPHPPPPEKVCESVNIQWCSWFMALNIN